MSLKRPFGVHAILDIYASNVSAQTKSGRWVHAVMEPYTGNRLIAAWWVLTGRAHAIVWPEAGDLEKAQEPRQ